MPNPPSVVPKSTITGCTTNPGRELRDLTVGVVGAGRIGVAVMDRLRGFGCRVLAFDRCRSTSAEYVTLEVLLRESDVVTLHAPLTADTHHLLDRRRIELMRRGACIINTARGALLDTEALLASLESGHLGGAALDVVEHEEGVFYSDHRRGLRRESVAVAVATTTGCGDHSPHRLLHGARPERHRPEHARQLSSVRKTSPVDRLKLAVIFGGCSEEHPVSVKSAQEVARHLDLGKYEPCYIGITQDGAWKLSAGPRADWESDTCRPVTLSPDRRVHGLLLVEQERYETVHVDVAFPVLHGPCGEDGAIQGLLELSGIPYVGCDVQSSAVCMDKSLAYVVARRAGIATPTFWTVTANEEIDLECLRYPVFVKPARSGSSFGVSKVFREDELPSAFETARRYDSKVLIEEAVVGVEVGCAIYGNEAELTVGALDRVALSHGFFRIHQEEEPERGSENATFVVPADIAAEAGSLVVETAKALYRALGCRGLARVDMFLKGDGSVVLNEVNTMPGLTSYSRYPRMMAAAGLPLSEVIDRLVSLALAGSGR